MPTILDLRHHSPRSRPVLRLLPWLLFAIALSCSKKNGGGNPMAPSAGTATVTGIALGSNGGGLPLANVSISANPSAGVTATSNSFGVFTLKVPAGTPVVVTARHDGYATHVVPLTLANGETRAVSTVLAALGSVLDLLVSSGGSVSDASSKSLLTLPGAFTTGSSNAFVSVTGLDPTNDQALAMPGSIAAESDVGVLLSLEPATVGEIEIGDGAGTDFPLVKPATLQLHLPASYAADARFGIGAAVPCFHWDDTAGHWKFVANGTVAVSSVDANPCVTVTVQQTGWFAAGFLSSSTGCVSGSVFQSGVPVAGATVEAFPGSLDVTKSDGTYHVIGPAGATVQLVAARPGAGAVTLGSAHTTASAAGGACTAQALTITPLGPPTTYTISAQLLRGRTGFIIRDQVRVIVVANTSPSATPLDGSVVQISDVTAGGAWQTVPLEASGLYVAITGSPGAISFAAGHEYVLRVDLEPDGIFDATARVLMPGTPTIVSPANGDVVNPEFTASWSDLATGAVDSVIYIGSFTSDAFSTIPAQFAVHAPTSGVAIGTGVGQPQYFMPNDSLTVGGPYTFRLWATNGPVRYRVGAQTIFATMNVKPTAPAATNIFGWFSATAQADSVQFTELGSGTAPHVTARLAFRR